MDFFALLVFGFIICGFFYSLYHEMAQMLDAVAWKIDLLRHDLASAANKHETEDE